MTPAPHLIEEATEAVLKARGYCYVGDSKRIPKLARVNETTCIGSWESAHIIAESRQCAEAAIQVMLKRSCNGGT